MFNKLVIIESINIPNTHIKKLETIAKEVIYYQNFPSSDEEIIKRIGNADAVLLSLACYRSKRI